MIMISQHYDIRELVAPTIYNHPAIGDRCVHFIHPNLPVTLEQMVKEFGEKPTVNDWHQGGQRKNSGLRDFNLPMGAKYSSHYYGNTADTIFHYSNPQYVFKYIMDNQDKFPYIIRMENVAKTPTWNHIEVGSKRLDDIKIFNP